MTFVGALLEVRLSAFELRTFGSRIPCINSAHLTVKVTLAGTKALHGTAGSRSLSAFLRLCGGASLGFGCLALSPRISLRSLDLGHFVAIQYFNLRHSLDNFQAVVRLLS